MRGIPIPTKEQFLARHPWAKKPVVIYLGEDIVVANKPPGWVVVPDRWNKTAPHLRGWMEKKLGRRVSVVHRLDWHTSGVCVFVCGDEAYRQLSMAFMRGQVKRRYLAVVEGQPSPCEGRVELPLVPVSKGENVYRVDFKEGKYALTHYRVVVSWGSYSVVVLEPRTGRTHQLRVHMQALGTPIVGDAVYGGNPFFLSVVKPHYRRKSLHEEKPLIERAALHAWQLSLPGRGTFTAALPRDLRAVLRALMLYMAPVKIYDQVEWQAVRALI